MSSVTEVVRARIGQTAVHTGLTGLAWARSARGRWGHGLQMAPSWRPLVAVLAVAWLATAAPPPLLGQSDNDNAAQRSAITSFAQRVGADVAADDVGGITAAVVRGSEVVWARGFGWADRESRIPAGVGSIYRTGSISKTFTAVVMMQAIERGYLEADAPLSSSFSTAARFPDAHPGTNPPTFRQFASHTSGLVREPAWDSAASGPIGIWEERIVESIRLSPFQAAPGDEYSYSNIAFGVLGLAVARATGRPFMELVREDVFHPLGMSSSTFVIDSELTPRLAAGYANRGQSIDAAFPAREHAGRGYKVPNGGVYSTVADLARFMGAIGGNAPMPILSDESRLEMMRVHAPEDPDAGYGLGLMVQKSPAGDWLVGHSGSVAGYSA